MKRIHLFSLCMLGIILGYAQPNRPQTLPVIMPDTAFIYSTQGNIYGFCHYIYNNCAQRTEEHYYVSDNGQWKEQTRKFYTYDTHGNILRELQQQQVNGQWENLLRNDYAYDAQQHKTLYHNQIWNDTLHLPRVSFQI